MSKKSLINVGSHLLLRVHVRPNAKSNAVRQIIDDEQIRLDIAADAQSGKANQELIAYLKSLLKISSNRIEIVHGHKSREKLVRIMSDSVEDNQLFFKRLADEISPD